VRPERIAVSQPTEQPTAQFAVGDPVQMAGVIGHFEVCKTLIDAQRLTILELLLLFPTCKPDLGLLVSSLPTLQPRYYSLSCSALSNPFRMSVAFTVVHYECGAAVGSAADGSDPDCGAYTPTAAIGTTPSLVAEAKHHALAAAEADTPSLKNGIGSGGVGSSRAPRIYRKGLATTYLERLCAGLLHASASNGDAAGCCSELTPPEACPRIMTFLRPNRHFNVPAAPETPFIMIGPGTGVAPFIGFLQHRRARVLADEAAAVAVCRGWWRSGLHISTLRDDNSAPHHYGATWLFFGNRHPDVDFLFRDELSEFLGNGSLSRLYTAFSREGPEKVYVQQRMREEGKHLAELIVDRNASIFVCGDGMAMARDVHEALLSILLEHRAGNFPNGRVDAEAFLQQMTKVDRYCKDVWS
jgi:sulfite reductase alpha subunit-like flavoprotein